MKLKFNITLRTDFFNNKTETSCRLCNRCTGIVKFEEEKYPKYKFTNHDIKYYCEKWDAEVDIFTSEEDSIPCRGFEKLIYKRL